jgi:tetratricopeptide (TPR) repeat protein
LPERAKFANSPRPKCARASASFVVERDRGKLLSMSFVHRRNRLQGAYPTLTLLFLTCALLPAGCRIFRGHKVSDESIAVARQLSLQGIDAQQRGQWDRAEMLFATAILKCPNDDRARNGYAESLWQRGACADAISHMEEAVRLSGNDPERLVRLGQMYRSRGDLAQAARMAQRAIVSDSQSAAAWALRGSVQQAQGQRTEALASYHRALSYELNLPDVQLAIADIYAQENRPQRALATLQSLAASFAPARTPAEVLFREGLALRALGRIQDSVQALAEAAAQRNPPPELLYELARSQLLTGDSPAARHTVAMALRSYPRHVACLALAEELSATEGSVITASAVSSARR